MKTFARKREGKVIAGVSTGVAHYFGIDPVLIRLAMILLLIVTGFVPLIIVYLLAAFFVPYEDDIAKV